MRRMMIAALCLASAPLAGCTTTSAGTAATTQTALGRAAAAYTRIRAAAETALPYVPEPAAARIRRGLDAADAALALARTGATPEERAAALAQLAGVVAEIVADLSTG